ncbi:MAG: helix-turn-helix transcriptional regulator [Lentisphaeria bacterium]|jgi:AraC-like DNA-binding protein
MPKIGIAHLREGFALHRFRAPAGRDCLGRRILPGCEEVELIIDGEGFFEWEGTLHPCRRGTILWHLPGEETIWRNNPAFPYECLVLVFPVAAARPRGVPRLSLWPPGPELDAFVEELQRCYHRDPGDRDLLGLQAYVRLLWQAHLAARREPVAALPAAVRAALELVERRFPSPLSVPELARRAGVSPVHLHALFRRHLGRTPHRLLLERRLQEARHLLAAGDRQVKEVGYACGFRDTVHFCRCFKAKIGLTPAAYRAQYRRQPAGG